MKSLGSFIKLTRTAVTSDYVYQSKYKFTSKYQALKVSKNGEMNLCLPCCSVAIFVDLCSIFVYKTVKWFVTWVSIASFLSYSPVSDDKLCSSDCCLRNLLLQSNLILNDNIWGKNDFSLEKLKTPPLPLHPPHSSSQMEKFSLHFCMFQTI